MSHTSARALVFTTGFVLCLLLTLINFLDFSPGSMAIFGFLTIVFFLLLLRTPRKASCRRVRRDSRAEFDQTPCTRMPVRNDSIRTCVH